MSVGWRAVPAFIAAACAAGCGRPSPAPSSVAQVAGSVLLITIDTLRADVIGAYGAGGARTPAIDALASRGTLFDRAYATAPITLTSHASLLTGLYPPAHGARHNGMAMRTDVATLAERFRQAGARTAAFVSAFPLDRSFGLARGFELYSDRMPRAADGRVANERPGRTTVDEALGWIQEHRSERVFVWVHLFEPHAPYGNPADGRPARERYVDDVAEADRQVARLMDGITTLAGSTLVIVAGDHGEAFGEHGEIAHSIFVYDTTLRVPLILAGPGVASGKRSDAVVSLIDVVPTIARLAAIGRWDTDGEDLGSAAAGSRALYAESFAPLLDFGWSSLRSLRSGRWKYVEAPRAELFDLRADPEETNNVVDRYRSEAENLRAVVGRISGPELPANAAGTTDEAKRRLQALGYVSGGTAGTSRSRRDPKDAKDLARRIALVTSGELSGEELERELLAVLRLDPANPQANLRLGYIRIGQGRCSDARPLLQRAIRGNVPGADSYVGLATCQGAEGDVRGALASLERAREREPHNAVVLGNIGIALAKLHESRRAAAALGDALAIDPDLHEARFNLSLVYARAGNREAARTQAEELLRRLPADAPQRPEVERLLRTLGR